MQIIRVEKNTNYTVIANYHLEDHNLSLKAMGLMTFILHLPKNWNINISSLNSVLKDGKTSIENTLKELEENGYLTRNKIRDEFGKIKGIEHILHEKPEPETPKPEKPLSEKQVHINTIIYNKLSNKNTIDINKKNIIKENFDNFWKAYPKKKDKAKTEKWFEKNKPNEELMKIILESLDKFKKTKDWQKDNGQYIPLPTTWLNGKRWEDEISENDIEMTDEEETRMLEEEFERRKRERDTGRNQEGY